MNLRVAFLIFAAAVVSIPAGAGVSPKSVAAELEALAARVAKLEGNIVSADLVGTYSLNAFQSEMNAWNLSVSTYVFQATVELTADGTFSFGGVAPGVEKGNTLRLDSSPGVFPFVGSSDPGAFTAPWTYANGTLSVGGSIVLDVAAGGRVMVGTSVNHSNGTTVILILTRVP